MQERGGQDQAEEWLRQLYRAHAGDAALCQAAIPEDEADKHAE
jgi:hypothetical protein